MVSFENAANIAEKSVKNVSSKYKSSDDAAGNTELIVKDVDKPSQDATSKSVENGKTLDASTPLDSKRQQHWMLRLISKI